MRSRIFRNRGILALVLPALLVSLVFSCASPGKTAGEGKKGPKAAAIAGGTKNGSPDPAVKKGTTVPGTRPAPAPAGSGKTKADSYPARTFKADYSRKDLLWIQGFGDGKRTLVTWMVGRDTLKTQKTQNMDQLLAALDMDLLKSLALAWGAERWHADFEATGFEVLSVDTETFGPRREGLARNDWIIVVSLREKGADFNERVPFLPDGTQILSSMD